MSAFFLKKGPIILSQSVLKNLILVGLRLLKEDGMFFLRFVFKPIFFPGKAKNTNRKLIVGLTTDTSYYVANNSVFSIFSKPNRRTIRDRVGILGSNTDSRK